MYPNGRPLEEEEDELDMYLGKMIIIAQRGFHLELFCSILQLSSEIFILSYTDKVN
jgi:hypothetical protein